MEELLENSKLLPSSSRHDSGVSTLSIHQPYPVDLNKVFFLPFFLYSIKVVLLLLKAMILIVSCPIFCCRSTDGLKIFCGKIDLAWTYTVVKVFWMYIIQIKSIQYRLFFVLCNSQFFTQELCCCYYFIGLWLYSWVLAQGCADVHVQVGLGTFRSGNRWYWLFLLE